MTRSASWFLRWQHFGVCRPAWRFEDQRRLVVAPPVDLAGRSLSNYHGPWGLIARVLLNTSYSRLPFGSSLRALAGISPMVATMRL